jgi:poly-gamma-glutamate synthesis protein (capsule biosynthesis protein)
MRCLYKAIAALLRLLTLGRWNSSRPLEGNAATMTTYEKLRWAAKFYGRPISEPEKGKGIREYFAKHSLEGFAAGTAKGQSPGAGAASEVDAQPQPVLTLGLAGDILPSHNISAQNTGHFFADIIDFYLGTDLRYANLESPIVADRPVSIPSLDMTAPPMMNNSTEVFDLLHMADKGINVFSTANNHALDQGEGGLRSTLEFLDSRGVAHTGCARSPLEAAQTCITELRGQRVAWLSWTFSLNKQERPAGHEYLVNHLRINLPDCDVSPILAQVQCAREQAGLVVLCLHWGLEYEAFPLASQIDLAHRLLEAGVDIIVGNHPHGLQPAERYVCADGRETLALYALGDLVSDMPQVAFSALTAVARVELMPAPGGHLRISKAEVKPLYAYRHLDEQGRCISLRLLDFARLSQQLASGSTSYHAGDGTAAFTRRQMREVRRLRAALDNIMPAADRIV